MLILTCSIIKSLDNSESNSYPSIMHAPAEPPYSYAIRIKLLPSSLYSTSCLSEACLKTHMIHYNHRTHLIGEHTNFPTAQVTGQNPNFTSSAMLRQMKSSYRQRRTSHLERSVGSGAYTTLWGRYAILIMLRAGCSRLNKLERIHGPSRKVGVGI